MKKILSLVVVLIAIGQVYATGTESHSPVGISVIQKGAVVKLFYRGEQSGKVKVTIYNEKGAVVYKEVLENTEQFMRPYNFSPLPSGDYVIELRDEQATRTQKISHNTKVNRQLLAHLRRTNPGENKYILAVPNEGKDELTVRIYGQDHTLLYQETEAIEGDFAKLYNLDKVKGDHVFEVADKSGRVNRLSKPSH